MIPYWIELFIQNREAGDSFVEFITAISSKSQRRIYELTLKGDSEGARYLAHELSVYEKLLQTFEKELRERQDQIERS